ncbi:hypothetical protein Nstercoris_00438 [Nitrosomonas stercoris]|uniref:Uncharacterized protein n=1 Tax=Nitrosomonas stercoris TaxID=1444684 RepID=A0A4Y1YN10_9PROT|nr:hypothetical protein Nstercoris_00438 [Nitrosomonas stercoris]
MTTRRTKVIVFSFVVDAPTLDCFTSPPFRKDHIFMYYTNAPLRGSVAFSRDCECNEAGGGNAAIFSVIAKSVGLWRSSVMLITKKLDCFSPMAIAMTPFLLLKQQALRRSLMQCIDDFQGY